MSAPALTLVERSGVSHPSPSTLSLVADAAALRRRVRLLEAELAQQAALLDARSRFLTQISQELRAPLNGVVGMAQLLTGTPLNAEQGEIVQMLAGSAEQVLTAINDVLDFSKIESGTLRLDRTRFDLWSIVESVFEMVSPAAAEKHLRLAFLPDPDVPEFFEGDAIRLRQVLLNLVSNAVRFTYEGEVIVRARITPLGSNGLRGRLALSVSDTGVGIESAQLATLFDPYAVRPASLRPRGSAGLGLAIVQRLATLMQGHLTATSTPGAGSTFIFTVPLAVSFPARSTPPFVLTDKRVLVAEPHAPSLEMMTTLLSRTGATVLPATTVEDALCTLDAGTVDAAFYSATLSDHAGTRLLVRARQHAHGAHLPALELHPLGQRPSGTTVLTLSTPVQREAVYQAAHELLRATEMPANDTGAGVLGGTGASELRILLAEDNPINQMVALRLLDSLGYRADVVENGLEAVEAVQRRTYDVVLMDIMMPVMDGIEATRRIRQAQNKEQPRIIAVTANALASDRQRCLEAGMDEHIAKPLRVEVLANALKRFGGMPAAAEAPAHAAPAPAATGPSPETVLDLARLRELRESLGDEDLSFLQELVDDFLSDSVELLEQLTRSLDAGDAQTARRSVHTLKSSAAMFGATQLSDTARRAELAAKENDLDTVRSLADPLHEKFVAVEAEFERLSKNGYEGV